jgi:hypothetical protein
MKKVVKIREMKPKVKIVRELNKIPGEGDKEIEELTSEEMPAHEDDARISEPVMIDAPVRTGGAPATLTSATRNVSVQEEETDNRPLYDVGRAMGGAAEERQYKPVESVQSATLHEIGVGRDFAMGSGSSGGDYPDAQRVENRLRSEAERERKEYEAGRMETAETGGRRRRYPWQA